MKQPATESKGDFPPERPGQRLSASRVQASIQSPVRASVRRLAKSWASTAPKKGPNQKANLKQGVIQEKIAKKKVSKEKTAKEKTTQAQPARASEPSQASRKSPVPNLPFLKDSKAARVTFTLLLVRPWVLVAGLWLVSLLGSAVAIQGLIKPRALMKALPEAVAEAPPVVTSSIINVAEDEIESGETPAAEANRQVPGTLIEGANQAANEGNFPVWTVGALVGACAAGCLVMSRRRAMARLSVARSRSRVRKKPVKSVAVSADAVKSDAVTAGASQREQANKPQTVGVADMDSRELSRVKKRRQRNRRTPAPMTSQQALASKGRRSAGQKPQKQPQASQGGRVLVSRSAAQKANNANKRPANVHPARNRRVKRASARMAPRQGMVSVVPASESHALDWTNGSLAHQMDVRSQRKAM